MEPVRAWWRRSWRGTVAALVGLAGLAVCGFGPAGITIGAGEYRHWQARTALAATEPGTVVRDGPVSFIVHTVHCGDGGRFGRLCEVTIEARNDGAEPVTVPGVAQKLHGSRGARHSPIDGQPEPFGTLAPGQAATGTIRFDLPAHSTVTQVEVHATAYTRGRTVGVPGGPLPAPG